MAPQTGTLSAAIAAADKRVTVLDDKLDAEQHAEWLWLKARAIRVPHKRVVFGAETLPDPWQAKVKKFLSEEDAHTYLKQFAHNPTALAHLRDVAHIVEANLVLPKHDKDAISTVAVALGGGQAWTIELPPSEPPSRFIGKVAASVSGTVNGQFGTAVDFDYICQVEGGQWLRGYVPFGNDGKVAGRSGMTICSGFDVGQWNAGEINDLGLPKEVADQIAPFVNINFKGKTKAEVAAAVGKVGPVPLIEKKDQADATDTAVFGVMLGRAIKQWDPLRSPGVPAFKELPANWQTVWLSRVYQEGPYAHTSFRQLSRAGKWKEAADSLGSQTSYAARVQGESAMLKSTFPAPVVAPAPPGKK